MISSKLIWNLKLNRYEIFEKCYTIQLSKTKFDNSQLYVVYYTSAGDNREKVPPVLISNTEVKLLIVENTWLETVRKNRTLPAHLNKTPERVFFCCLNNVLSFAFLFKEGNASSACFPESVNNALRFAKISFAKARF